MMNKVKVLSLAALALPLAVNAQPAAGDWDVSLGGGGFAQNDFNGSPASGTSGGFNAQLSLGYFVNDNIEVGVRQMLGYGSSPVGALWNGTTSLALDYNIHMDKLVPFIGGNIGYTYGNKGFPDTWGFAPEAGLKWYMQEKAYLFGMAEYMMPFQGKTFKNGLWRFTVGIGLNL
jgi:hypothetical protein